MEIMAKLNESELHRRIGERLANSLRDRKGHQLSPKILQAIAVDLAEQSADLILPLRVLVSRPAFAALITKAGTGTGSVERHALLHEVQQLFLPGIVKAISEILDGFLGLPATSGAVVAQDHSSLFIARPVCDVDYEISQVDGGACLKDEQYWLDYAISTIVLTGDHESAICHLNKALRINPGNAQAWRWLAEFKIRTGDIRESIFDYGKALEINAGDAIAWQGRGTAKARAGDIEGAIVDYDKSLEVDPGDCYVLQLRGFAKAEMEDIEGAMVDFDLALGNDPSDALSWFGRGYAKYKADDCQGAYADMCKALEMDPAVKKRFMSLLQYFTRERV